MIKLDRSRIRVPDEILERAHVETGRLFAEYRQGKFELQRVRLKVELIRDFRPFVTELSYGKCCYCESPLLAVAPGDIENYRPKSLYFWLAYDWNNLLLACPTCNRYKRDIFPLAGDRPSPFEPLNDKLLLLDPSVDDPEIYMTFLNDGSVRARELPPYLLAEYGDRHRGTETIEALRLNRESLIQARAEVAQTKRIRAAEMMRSQPGPDLEVRLRSLGSSQMSYAAVVRQVVAELLAKLHHQPPPATAPPEPTVPGARPAYEPAVVESIEIQNFRAIRDLELTAPAGWKVLLGDNATGKTSVLRAVAFALMGEEYVKGRFRNGKAWLTRKSHSGGGRGKLEPEGRIRVRVNRENAPIEIHFTEESIDFISGADGARTFVRGYGAIRLPGRKLSAAPPQLKNVENLFNHQSPLVNAGKWFSRVQDRLRPAVLAIRDILLLPEDAPVFPRKRGLDVMLHGATISTDDLSSGYHDMLNLAADIMSGFPEPFKDAHEIYGIVLLDELGAHLHPQWRMQIVDSLKETFKGIQFLVTTHEPLCLRGLDEDEVAVLERHGDAIQLVEDVPSPRHMRVDQLLTFALFGLQSTVDPRLDAEFAEYYDLIAKGSLTPEEQRQMSDLRDRLAPVSALGTTRRDQLLNEILDEFLAKETSLEAAQTRSFKETTKQNVWRRWREIEAEEQ